jgi:hypothetical protein
METPLVMIAQLTSVARGSSLDLVRRERGSFELEIGRTSCQTAYRAITYAMHVLNHAPEHDQFVETAFVYQDIGLWTDHELAYLEPSETVALKDNEKFG